MYTMLLRGEIDAITTVATMVSNGSFGEYALGALKDWEHKATRVLREWTRTHPVWQEEAAEDVIAWCAASAATIKLIEGLSAAWGVRKDAIADKIAALKKLEDRMPYEEATVRVSSDYYAFASKMLGVGE